MSVLTPAAGAMFLRAALPGSKQVDPMRAYLLEWDQTGDLFSSQCAAAAALLWNNPDQYVNQGDTDTGDFIYDVTRRALSDAMKIHSSTKKLTTTTGLTGAGRVYLLAGEEATGWDRSPLQEMTCVFFTLKTELPPDVLAAALSPLIVEQGTPVNIRCYGPPTTGLTLDAVNGVLTRKGIEHFGVRTRPKNIVRRHLQLLNPTFWSNQGAEGTRAINKMLSRKPTSSRAAAFDTVHAGAHGPLVEHVGEFCTQMARTFNPAATGNPTYADYCVAKFPNWITDLDDRLRGAGMQTKLAAHQLARTQIEQTTGETVGVSDPRIRELLGWGANKWDDTIAALLTGPGREIPVADPGENTQMGKDQPRASGGLPLTSQTQISKALVTAALMKGGPPDVGSGQDPIPFMVTYLQYFCGVPAARITTATGMSSSTMSYRVSKVHKAMRTELYHMYLEGK